MPRFAVNITRLVVINFFKLVNCLFLKLKIGIRNSLFAGFNAVISCTMQCLILSNVASPRLRELVSQRWNTMRPLRY